MSTKLAIKKNCLWCSSEFIAQRTSTKYCSHKCNNKAYKAQKREEKVEQQKKDNLITLNAPYLEKLNSRDYLKVNEVATLLGLSRQTIYKLIQSGQLQASSISTRLTLVKRSDIDEMFEKSKIKERNPVKARKVPIVYYSISEIKEAYNIRDSWVYKIIRDNRIPKITKKGKSYYSKSDFDKYFKVKGRTNPDNIREWMSVKEICSMFSLTTPAAYTLVSRHEIPKIKKGNSVLYSKQHVLIAKGAIEPPSVKYYSTQEAMQKFNLTRDSLYAILRTKKISKIKEGRYIKISKPELDNVLNPQKELQWDVQK